jgi:hypothetical protein
LSLDSTFNSASKTHRLGALNIPLVHDPVILEGLPLENSIKRNQFKNSNSMKKSDDTYAPVLSLAKAPKIELKDRCLLKLSKLKPKCMDDTEPTSPMPMSPELVHLNEDFKFESICKRTHLKNAKCHKSMNFDSHL